MTREEHYRLISSPSWRRFRKSIIAGGRCDHCLQLHAPRKLEVHHEPPVGPETTLRQFFDRSKVVCLCIYCHSSITSKTRKPKTERIVPLGKDGRLTAEWIRFRKRRKMLFT